VRFDLQRMLVEGGKFKTIFPETQVPNLKLTDRQKLILLVD
jgi:hypothetical protein